MWDEIFFNNENFVNYGIHTTCTCITYWPQYKNNQIKIIHACTCVRVVTVILFSPHFASLLISCDCWHSVQGEDVTGETGVTG